MALFNCSECGREISDKAISCPHCGCPVSAGSATRGGGVVAAASVAPAPMPAPVVAVAAPVVAPVAAPARPEVKKELFEVGKKSFVLSEIVALTEIGFKRWLAVASALATLALLYGLVNVPEPGEWTIWAILIVFTIGATITYILTMRIKSVETTGGENSLDAPFEPILQQYAGRAPADTLVHYQGQSQVYRWRFVVNTDRIAQYELEEIWSWTPFIVAGSLTFVGMVLPAAEGYSGLGFALLALGLLLAVIAFLARSTTVTITGVGGKPVVLHISTRDAARVKAELDAKIQALVK